MPQGSQPHIYLLRGLRAAEELVPGLTDDLRAAGARPFDTASRLAGRTRLVPDRWPALRGAVPDPPVVRIGAAPPGARPGRRSADRCSGHPTGPGCRAAMAGRSRRRGSGDRRPGGGRVRPEHPDPDLAGRTRRSPARGRAHRRPGGLRDPDVRRRAGSGWPVRHRPAGQPATAGRCRRASGRERSLAGRSRWLRGPASASGRGRVHRVRRPVSRPVRRRLHRRGPAVRRGEHPPAIGEPASPLRADPALAGRTAAAG